MSEVVVEKGASGRNSGSSSTSGSANERDEPRKAINAMSWSLGMKIYHTAIPCFLAFLITFSASITVPATSAFIAEFNVNRTAALLPETLYMLGLAFGPLIMAPLSEFIGRRWLYLVTSSSIIAFAGGCGAAQNFATLLICRFLCAFLGSAGVAIGAGTILDVWGMEKAGAMARLLFICGPFLGPSMAPLTGAYVMHEYHGDWRWTQWVVALIGAPIWILVLFMKETSDVQVPHSAKHPGRFPVVQLALSTLKAAVLRSMTMLTTEAIAFSLTLYTGYAYAVVFSFFASATYVYELDYDFSSRQIGLSFISVVIGYGLAAVMHVIVDMTLYARAVRQAPNGRPAPEHRLYAAMIGSIFLPMGLFWFV
ncbi:hypothetical protein CLAIMM_03763 isoform 4 [Cladophialophora immunda]|nr:hypothetical protein CLAIMM_03763 isoform 3 [Cladophialophora immunda]OQU97897.1 hypothetical protein CLAIMM_03763 isoform 4 [Cladophialophora immunda]